MWLTRVALQVAVLAANHPPEFVLRDLPATRGVSEDAQLVWYAVQGATRARLRAQMDRLGPEGYAGMTRDHVRWHYTLGGDGTVCWVSAVRVTLTDSITLPQWTPPHDANPELLAEWWRYLSMLKRHEEGHRQIAFDGAARIAQAIGDLRSAPTCDAVGQAANTVGHAIMVATQEQQVTYDRATRHGFTQGASLEDVGERRPLLPTPRVGLAIMLVVALAVAGAAVRRRGEGVGTDSRHGYRHDTPKHQ